MAYFKIFYEQLLSWQFWLVCAVLLPVAFLLRKKGEGKIHVPNLLLYFIVFLTALLVAMPFWIDGANSAIGENDDVWALLVNRMAWRMHSESTLWNRALAGGGAFNFLGLPLFSSMRFYTQFLEIWQEYTLIIFINMMLMFVFSWKILVEILKTNRWFAFFGGLLCALTQGFWASKFQAPQTSYGHGMAILPAMIYGLHIYFHRRFIYLFTVLLGIVYAFSIPLPLHSPPMAFLTIGLWLLFFHRSNLRRCALILLLFAITVFVYHLQYILTVIPLLPETGRGNEVMRYIRFLPFGGKIWLFASLLIVGLLMAIRMLNLHKDKQVVRMVGLPIAFLLIPVFAYVLQESKIVPGYRWALFYWGNVFIYILALVFIVERIGCKIYQRNKIAGLWGRSCALFLLVLLCLHWFCINIGYGFDSSYHYGSWNYLTENPVLRQIKSQEKEPFRVLQYGTEPDIAFLGYYDGLEFAGGVAPFVDKERFQFWKYLKKGGHTDPNVLSIREEADGNLSSIHGGLLKLLNVKYVFSKKPIQNKQLKLAYFTPAVGTHNECHRIKMESNGLESEIVMWGSFFEDISTYWWNLKCRWKQRNYIPPLYVYALESPFPRIYAANKIRWKPSGKEFEDNDFIKFVLGRNAILRKESTGSTGDSEDSVLGTGVIQINSYKQDRIDFEVLADSKAFIVLSDPNNRFWRLFINGRENKYYKTNVVQTGFFVDKGRSSVSYVYCPPFRSRDAICSLL